MPGYVQTWFTRTFLPCGSYHKNVWEFDMSKQHLHILDIAEKNKSKIWFAYWQENKMAASLLDGQFPVGEKDWGPFKGTSLGGGFNSFKFSPLHGKMMQFD